VTVDRTGPGAATLHGLAAGQAVVCTVTNTHQDQGVRLQKTLAGPATQNPDGAWTIRYTLAVANRSALAATTYDLTDTLHFGGGIVVQQASWSGPTSGAFSGTTATLAQGAALAAGQTADYTVSVTATVGAGAWRDRTTDCPDGSGDGGFLNTATVASAGETSSSSACDSPGTLTVRKTAGEVTPGPQGHVTIGYDIVVTNTTPKPQFYDLVDTPQPAGGATVVSATATKNGDPVPYDGGTLASGAGIGGGSPEHPVTDRYTVTLEVDVGALDTAQATCDGAGTGLFNAATLSSGTIATEADACADLPTGTITLVKTVAAGFGGDQPSDAWTLTAAGSSGRTISGRYTASDPDPAITKVVVPTGSYALTEGPAIPGYALTGLACVDANDGPVAVSGDAVELAAGMDVTCTFTNTPRPAHLTLIKEVADPDGSGATKTPHDWTLTATPAFDGFEPVSGRGDPQRPDGVSSVPVWAGRYDLSESGPAGFAAGQWTCEGGAVDGSAVTIPLGADVTCTITNTATLPRLTLVKVVDNGDTGGRGEPSDWIVSAAGPTSFGGPGSDDPSQPDPAITHIGVAVGDYTLSEDGSAAPAGYELAGLSCTDTTDGTVLDTSAADPTLHLAEGDDVVCTFTNRAIPAAWTLSKTSNRGATVMPGDVIRYELTLTHTAGVLPRLLLLRDIDDLSGVTPHAAFVPGSLSASSGAATLQNGRLDWTLTDPSGGAFTVAYSFRVAQDAWGVTLRNALTPPRDVTCPEGTCETTSSTPDLELWKTATVTSKPDPADPARVLPGGTVAYTLYAHNPTAVDLPAGQTETDDVSGLIGHATLGTLGAGLTRDGADRLTWTLPAVPAGATVTVGYSVTVAADAAGSTLTNTLVPDTGHCVPPGEDGTGCTTTNRVPRIDLGIVKTASTQGPVDDDPGASSAYSYTLTVTNHGDSEATDAVLTDVLPEQLDLDVAKGSGGFDSVPAGWTPSYDQATSTVSVRIPSLAVGASAAIQVHVLVRPVVHGSVDSPISAVPPGEDGPSPVVPAPTIDNRACVDVADDVDPSNDCSTVSVPHSGVAANIWVQCQADIPYLHYAIAARRRHGHDPVAGRRGERPRHRSRLPRLAPDRRERLRRVRNAPLPAGAGVRGAGLRPVHRRLRRLAVPLGGDHPGQPDRDLHRCLPAGDDRVRGRQGRPARHHEDGQHAADASGRDVHVHAEGRQSGPRRGRPGHPERPDPGRRARRLHRHRHHGLPALAELHGHRRGRRRIRRDADLHAVRSALGILAIGTRRDRGGDGAVRHHGVQHHQHGERLLPAPGRHRDGDRLRDGDRRGLPQRLGPARRHRPRRLRGGRARPHAARLRSAALDGAAAAAEEGSGDRRLILGQHPLLPPEDRCGPGELRALQGVDDVVECGRRVAHRVRNRLDGRVHRVAIEMELVEKELIGVLGFDIPGREFMCGEVVQVEGDDRRCPGPDRCGENVAIPGIRQRHARDDRFISRDEAIGDRLAHQFARARQPVRRDVRVVGAHITEYLVEDLLCPAGVHQPGLGDLNEHMPQCRRIQDVGVIDDREAHSFSPESCDSDTSSAKASRRRSPSVRWNWRSESARIRRCVPTIRYSILPSSSSLITCGRDTLRISAACAVVSSAFAGMIVTPRPAAMLLRIRARSSTASRGTGTVSSPCTASCRTGSPACALRPCWTARNAVVASSISGSGRVLRDMQPRYDRISPNATSAIGATIAISDPRFGT